MRDRRAPRLGRTLGLVSGVLSTPVMLAGCASSSITQSGGLSSYQDMTAVKTGRTKAKVFADPDGLSPSRSACRLRSARRSALARSPPRGRPSTQPAYGAARWSGPGGPTSRPAGPECPRSAMPIHSPTPSRATWRRWSSRPGTRCVSCPSRHSAAGAVRSPSSASPTAKPMGWRTSSAACSGPRRSGREQTDPESAMTDALTAGESACGVLRTLMAVPPQNR